MGAYENVLHTAAGLSFFGVRHLFGFIVRFLTESHVRVQLQRLFAAYAVIEQTLGPRHREAEWFSAARDQLECSSAALRNLAGSFAAATPLAALIAFVSITSPLGVWPTWRAPAIIVLVVAALGAVVYGMHKRVKRGIFDAAESGASVAELEAALFAHLPVHRRRDVPSEVWAWIFVACLVAIVIIAQTAPSIAEKA